MELNREEKVIQEEAIRWIKKNKKKLIEEFILNKKVLPLPALAIFMAGSPGVGKTEYSKNYEIQANNNFLRVRNNKKLLKLVSKVGIDFSKYEKLFVRIDIDEIRDFIPQYKRTDVVLGIKGNAHIIQKAANIGLDYLRSYCINNDFSFLLDGTFGNQFSTFDKIIRKVVLQGRVVSIFFIYVSPLTAWDFTKKREVVEGRNIKKDNFIKQYFKSLDNLKRIKEKFGDKIILNFVLKKIDNSIEKVFFNKKYEEVVNILEKSYNFSSIDEKFLEENLK